MISIIVPVYRDATSALRLVAAVERCQLPVGEAIEVVVVDDGSNDSTSGALVAANVSSMQVVSLPTNRGRAGACNAGAVHARGEILFFMDCDCMPADVHLLRRHLEGLYDDFVACTGPITGTGGGFWQRYQADASRRRRQMYGRGAAFAGTTANFSVHASDFRAVGGFCTDYRKYGFEDRDLLIRLARRGRINWCSDAVVLHQDHLTLREVVTKMHTAGGASARLFSRNHPDAYRELGYAMLDVRIHPWLRPVAWLAKPILRTASMLDRLLAMPLMPYSIARRIVKSMSALAYLSGTATRP